MTLFCDAYVPRIDADPRRVRLLGDRLLVRVEPEPDKIGLIVVPMSAQNPGNTGQDRYLRYGVVVRVGPGDRCGTPEYKAADDFDVRGCLTWTNYKRCPGASCPRCHGTGRLPMIVRPGNTVLYDHPSDKQFEMHGEIYVFIHEQQHVRAIVRAINQPCQ